MTRERFMDLYIISWLAATSVEGYLDRCNSGKHYEVKDIPIEDAYVEADMAWEAYLAYVPRERRRETE